MTNTTITVSMPDEFEKIRKQHPYINWNEIIKQGLLNRLSELKKFKMMQENRRL